MWISQPLHKTIHVIRRGNDVSISPALGATSRPCSFFRRYYRSCKVHGWPWKSYGGLFYIESTTCSNPSLGRVAVIRPPFSSAFRRRLEERLLAPWAYRKWLKGVLSSVGAFLHNHVVRYWSVWGWWLLRCVFTYYEVIAISGNVPLTDHWNCHRYAYEITNFLVISTQGGWIFSILCTRHSFTHVFDDGVLMYSVLMCVRACSFDVCVAFVSAGNGNKLFTRLVTLRALRWVYSVPVRGHGRGYAVRFFDPLRHRFGIVNPADAMPFAEGAISGAFGFIFCGEKARNCITFFCTRSSRILAKYTDDNDGASPSSPCVFSFNRTSMSSSGLSVSEKERRRERERDTHSRASYEYENFRTPSKVEDSFCR